MKRLFSLLLCVCLSLSFEGCEADMPVEPVGGDWHVWGIYDFRTIGDLKVAVLRKNNEEGLCTGYEVYHDGSSLGPFIFTIDCADGGYKPGDIDTDASWLMEDHDQDGKTDVGIPIKNGDVMWYLGGESQYGESTFTFDPAENAN